MTIILERRGTMYDPAVVDTFVTIWTEIGAVAMEPVPHQSALARIGLAISAPAPQPVPVSESGTDAPDDLLAIVSLSRIIGGEATLGDAAALATSHLSRLLPDATCVFYLRDASGGRLVARHATGPHAAAVRGFTMAVGERLTGWVAACRQTITNSDAALDLFDREVTLGQALSTPLMDGDRLVGVFSAYAVQAFTENQSRLVQMTAPHLGRILGTALRSEAQRTSDALEPRASAHDLRVVVSRLRTG
jgi:GAF domain-containing protein